VNSGFLASFLMMLFSLSCEFFVLVTVLVLWFGVFAWYLRR